MDLKIKIERCGIDLLSFDPVLDKLLEANVLGDNINDFRKAVKLIQDFTEKINAPTPFSVHVEVVGERPPCNGLY